MFRNAFWPLTCGVVVMFGLGGRSTAAIKAGTDVVRLHDGRVVRGQIIRRKPDGGLLMVVRRQWLHQTEPGLAEEAIASEQHRSREALEQLAARIEAMLGASSDRYGDVLLVFLRMEQARIADLLDAPALPQPQFLWLPLPAGTIRDVVVADPVWRGLVQWGWHEDLPDVESLSQQNLTRALKEKLIDFREPAPTLGERLPPLPQGEDEWVARMAIIEDAYGDPVAFQGSGDLVVRDDGEAAFETLLPVITKMFSGGVGALLQADDRAGQQQAAGQVWRASARHQAQGEGRFRATRVQTLPEQGLVTVESVFEAQLTDGRWVTLWSDHEQVDATQVRADLEERIAADQRVGKALNLVRSLGIIDERVVSTAIRAGAATMEAKETSDRRLAAFRTEYTMRLDGPPLLW